jgi:hypothetical protein
MTRYLVMAGWTGGNFVSIAGLAFTDLLWFRILCWLWVASSLSVAGLVEVGAISHRS